MYEYRAIITQVYDGDTLTADIDLGFGVWLRGQKLRLYGVDTPEIKPNKAKGITKAMAERGKKVAGDVRLLLRATRDPNEQLSGAIPAITIQTKKDAKEKFGRWLAIALVPYSRFTAAKLDSPLDSALVRATELAPKAGSHLVSLNQWLLDTGRAKPMVY